MEDLMKVIKEANKELSEVINTDKIMKKLSSDKENAPVIMKNYIEKCEDLAKKYYERVKEQVSFNFFAELMILDMQYNFMGGGIPNKTGDIEINIE